MPRREGVRAQRYVHGCFDARTGGFSPVYIQCYVFTYIQSALEH